MCMEKRVYPAPLQELGGDWKRTTSAQVNGILKRAANLPASVCVQGSNLRSLRSCLSEPLTSCLPSYPAWL